MTYSGKPIRSGWCVCVNFVHLKEGIVNQLKGIFNDDLGVVSTLGGQRLFYILTSYMKISL